MVHVENALLRGPKWFHKGYAGRGNVEQLLDSCSGRTALVCGNGRGVFEEYEQVIALSPSMPVVFAANDVGVYLPHVDHFVSLHTPKLDLWVGLRRDMTSKGMGNKDFQVHDGGLYGEREWWQWTALTPTLSLSGLFGAQVAYLMGCEPVILAGCPNDATPRFFEAKPRGDGAYVCVQRSLREEMAYKPDFKRVIRSMSGWSREFFGGPEWHKGK